MKQSSQCHVSLSLIYNVVLVLGVQHKDSVVHYIYMCVCVCIHICMYAYILFYRFFSIIGCYRLLSIVSGAR